MLKAVLAFLTNRTSQNALIVAKMFAGFLSPLHRLELLAALAMLHNVCDKTEDAADFAATVFAAPIVTVPSHQ